MDPAGDSGENALGHGTGPASRRRAASELVAESEILALIVTLVVLLIEIVLLVVLLIVTLLLLLVVIVPLTAPLEPCRLPPPRAAASQRPAGLRPGRPWIEARASPGR